MGRISDEMDEIAELAEQLRGKSRAFSARIAARVDPRIPHDIRIFIWQAAKIWESLIGRWPGSGRSGPFVEFCAFAWCECGMRDIGEDVEDALGVQIEKTLAKGAIEKLSGL